MPHKYHVFVCTASRPPGHPRGSCTSNGGGQALLERLKARVQEGQLWDKGVSVAQSSCLGFCNSGPLVVVYPEGVWYRPINDDDVNEIVESHFLKGEVVERLRVSL